jgi:hypothetical protein
MSSVRDGSMEKEWNTKTLGFLVAWMGRGLFSEIRVLEVRNVLE